MNMQPEPELPGGRVLGQQLAEEDEEDAAQRRAEEMAHAAHDGHGHDLAGEGDVDQVGGDEDLEKGEEAAAEARHRRGEREGDELVALDGIAQEARAPLVVADGEQHPAERGMDHAPQRPGAEQHDGRGQIIEGELALDGEAQ